MNTASSSNHLRIAQVAPLWAAVPPGSYGGAELMVHWLTEALVEMGHEVTLFASGDSTTSAKLKAVCEHNLLETMKRGDAYQYDCYAASNFAEALRSSDAFDVIHSHIGASMIPFSTLSTIPILHTVHAGLDPVDEQWVLKQYSDVQIVAISNSQVASTPIERRRNIRIIYHGCDFDAYELSIAPGKYLAFLGRMGPQKNPLDAIRIAKEVGMPILLAGKPQNTKEKTYFNDQVRPLIDEKDVSYLGSINHTEKVELLKGACALIFPIHWEEHFGLVMIEAMACGTPVIALKRGSVGEVIDFGKTGFYGNSIEELVSFVPQAVSLKRKTVYEHAFARFSHIRMAQEYSEMYKLLISKCGSDSH